MYVLYTYEDKKLTIVSVGHNEGDVFSRIGNKDVQSNTVTSNSKVDGPGPAGSCILGDLKEGWKNVQSELAPNAFNTAARNVENSLHGHEIAFLDCSASTISFLHIHSSEAIYAASSTTHLEIQWLTPRASKHIKAFEHIRASEHTSLVRRLKAVYSAAYQSEGMKQFVDRRLERLAE